MTTHHIKVNPPRALTSEETQQSMQQWKINFKQYMKRDDSYRIFLNLEWNSSRLNYGLAAEADGQKRTPAVLADDLKDFLHILSSYVPHGYLTDKIIARSESLVSAFKIIEENFNLLPTQESFFEFLSLKKMSSETYRQMFDRMVAFSTQHLMPATTQNVIVDSIQVPAAGDKLTVSHLNLIALQWLSKIHPDLLAIVRTEYSKELRDNTPLSSLVPRISMNVDNLLMKYEKSTNVNLLSEFPVEANQTEADVCRVRGQRGRGSNFRGRGSLQSFSGGRNFCPGCFYLSKQLSANIHYAHSPAQCPRKSAVVQMLEAEDLTFADTDPDTTNAGESQPRSAQHRINNDYQEVLTQNNPIAAESNRYDLVHDHVLSKDPNKSMSMINHISQRMEKVLKASSPSLWLSVNGHCTSSIVDEGSELVVIDYEFSKKAKIPIEKTNQKAKSADNKSMCIVGQSKFPLQVTVKGTRVPVTIDLGQCVIISNLGCPVLIGQPAKIANEIVTYPHKSKIELKDIHGAKHTVSYPLPPPVDTVIAETLKSCQFQIVYPDEKISFTLPPKFSNCKNVLFSPRPSFTALSPSYLHVKGNHNILLTNTSTQPITIPKHAQVGDVRVAVGHDTALISRMYTIDDSTFEAFEQSVDWDRSNNYVNDVDIDPDGVMSSTWKEKFHDLCQQYADILQYKPATYNGYYGFVSNSIEFISTPPPTPKAYVPRYSKEMTDKLAAKMDELLLSGVLAKPEDIGVTPMFVSPSMLVPKPGSNGDYRMVTDLTKLNSFIRKAPAISPGIEETKLAIADFKYLCSIDLSQFFFQHKLEREDMQFLGVIHPYKGVLVYTVSPMGLRNSGELSYERLTRIFGDMQQARKLCRQADSLIVGGATLNELFCNLTEVFHRLRTCNLTIKPSKLIIAPKKVVMFGWEYSDQGWNPTPHTINPLSVAPEPKTIKQLRSWLGAAKQLSSCLDNYAVYFSPLEKVASNRKSQESVTWTSELSRQFSEAKAMLKSVKTVHYPTPTDKIFTYSDYSQTHHAIGGRLEFVRQFPDGSSKTFHGGFFSTKVSDCKARWVCCESEALACKLVIEHFKPILRENLNAVTHFCDNAPTVQAFNRAKQGKFSVSSRISSFLLSINELNIEIIHKSGAKIPATDFFSRNPISCDNSKCQICQFVAEEVFIGENAVRQVNASEILNGTFSMPYIQPSAWLSLQKKDQTLRQLTKLISNGQQPEPKKTGGENTFLKNLHSLYVKGSLKIARNGLITSEHTDENGQIYNPIVVPQNLFPGLVSALHLKLVHPSKYQMTKLLSRYFLCPGSTRVIADVVDSCHVCLSLKPLPPTLFSETTTVSNDFGSRFSADIMVRNSQHILFVVEKLTGFCFADILESETSANVGNSILSLIGQFISSKSCVIRTDGASIFQKLRSESQEQDSIWKKLGITFELGNSLHTNKNPTAENIIKEAHNSINKFGNKVSLSLPDLIMIVKHLNAKIRQHGYSSLELFSKRSAVNGEDVVLTDTKLADKQLATRLSSHNPPQPLSHDFVVGDLVMIRSKKDKLHPREIFIIQNFVVENDFTWAELVKFGSKLVNKCHKVRVEDLVKVSNTRPTRASAAKAADKIKSLIPILQRIQVSLSTPTHAWSYQDILEMISLQEDEFSVNHDQSNDSIDEEIEETSTETDDESFVDSEESLDQTITHEPNLVVQNFENILDNPSISAHPQVPSQVSLDTVQNLEAVFENIYSNAQSQPLVQPRESSRLASKPRPNYYQMQHGKQ